MRYGNLRARQAALEIHDAESALKAAEISSTDGVAKDFQIKEQTRSGASSTPACDGHRCSMVSLKKITARKRRDEPQNIVEIEITDPAKQIPDLIHWASKGEDLRVTLPSSLLRIKGAFGFHGGWNPMMLPLQNDIETFREFFKLFRPKNLSELYFLDEQFGPDLLSPPELPWLFWSNREPSLGEKELSTVCKPQKFFGPSTPRIIDREVQRLQSVLQSIRKLGYQPDKYGDTEGYFMQLNGEYRFLVSNGKHRAAALTFLGFKSNPVRMRPFWPRVIDGDRAGDWPLVRSGQMSEDFALAVMRRYFEFDGTQQRDRIFDLSSGPSFRAAG